MTREELADLRRQLGLTVPEWATVLMTTPARVLAWELSGERGAKPEDSGRLDLLAALVDRVRERGRLGRSWLESGRRLRRVLSESGPLTAHALLIAYALGGRVVEVKVWDGVEH